jgi:hypothetical protein
VPLTVCVSFWADNLKLKQNKKAMRQYFDLS